MRIRLHVVLLILGFAGLGLIATVVAWRHQHLRKHAHILAEFDDCDPSVEWEHTSPVGIYFTDPIGNFHLDDDDLFKLSELDSLRVVDIQFAPNVSNRGLAHLGKLTNLRGLNISFTSIGSKGLAPLTELVDLRTLGLCGTEVADDDLADVVALPKLEYLDLGFTDVTDAGLQLLSKSRSLRHVSLSVADKKVTETGISILKQRAPRLTVSTRLAYHSPHSPVPPPEILGEPRNFPPPGSENLTVVLLAEAQCNNTMAQFVCLLTPAQISASGLDESEIKLRAGAIFDAIGGELPPQAVEWFSGRIEPQPEATTPIDAAQLASLLGDALRVELRVGCLHGDVNSGALIVKQARVNSSDRRSNGES